MREIMTDQELRDKVEREKKLSENWANCNLIVNLDCKQTYQEKQ